MRNMQYNVCLCVGKVISINSTTRFLLFVSELTVPNLFVFFPLAQKTHQTAEKKATLSTRLFLTLVSVQYELLLLVGLTTDNVDALSVSVFDSKLN